MQRRTTTLYVAFFLLVAIGAFTVLAVTEKPVVTIENPDYELAQGQEFSVDGRVYNVTDVSAQITDGELVRSATAEWVNESARYRETWANNSTVTFGNETYRVSVPNESNPSTATLEAVRRLDNDTATVQQRNRTFVVRNGSNGTKTLVPLAEYKRQRFGESETRRLTVGSALQYDNNTTTVTNVSRGTATVAWTAPRTNTVEFGETTAVKTMLVRGGLPAKMQFPAGGNNVTLNGKTFTTHYPDNGTLVLSDRPTKYQSKLDEVHHTTGRIAGVWGVLILSSLVALLMTGLAFLPNK